MEEIKDRDEDAHDEFFAAFHFKKKIATENIKMNINKGKSNCLRDLTNSIKFSNGLQSNEFVNTNSNKKENVNGTDFFGKISKCDTFKIARNEKVLTQNINAEFNVNRKRKECAEEIINEFKTDIFDNQITLDCFIPIKRSKCTEIAEDPIDSDDIFVNYIEDGNSSNTVKALTTPANGYNNAYTHYLLVPEPSKTAQLIKIDVHSVLWTTVINSSKIDDCIRVHNTRKWCSPQEQYIVTENNQYESQCLIDVYFCQNPIGDPKDATFGELTELSKQYHYDEESLLHNLNTTHFHDLYMEKLPGNKTFDFMPSSNELTGSLLGGFINNLFEMSSFCFIPIEVIHITVDLIYQYLSRVNDVPLNDLRWVTLGSLWVSCKNEGLAAFDRIVQCTGYSLHYFRQAEMRLLMVVDFNLSKPHAINFRNRFLFMEQPSSTILHLSSFILDMGLHCYTLMLLPASKRAAAAIWLSRLIEKFEKFKYNDEFGLNKKSLAETMYSVWPTLFEKVTGYRHSEISLLAVKMHVIIIAFISGGESKYPSVSACQDKYSSLKYGKLTTSYEKFTASTVFYAIHSYCLLNKLNMAKWLEENEYETLCRNFWDNKAALSRASSCNEYNGKMLCFQNTDSCPELTMKPTIFRSTAGSTKPDLPGTSKDLSLNKLDSGYSTSSNTGGKGSSSNVC